MATYVVGDIHGCFYTYQALLKQIGFNKNTDILWSIGDIINRGPHSLQTLAYFYERKEYMHMILGNHELAFLAYATNPAQFSKKESHFERLLCADNIADYIAWLRQQPLLQRLLNQNALLVHAGIPPLWSFAEAVQHALFAESILQSPQHEIFLQSLYGDDSVFTEDSSDLIKARVVVNALTRMRFVTVNHGRIFLHDEKTANQEVIPWFAYPKKSHFSEKIVFGHWSMLHGAVQSAHCEGIDSSCVYGGALTILRLDDNRRFVLAKNPRDV